MMYGMKEGGGGRDNGDSFILRGPYRRRSTACRAGLAYHQRGLMMRTLRYIDSHKGLSLRLKLLQVGDHELRLVRD